MDNYEYTASAVDGLFGTGCQWPPSSSVERLRNYALNQKLYDGKHPEVFKRLNKVFNDNEAEHQKLILVFNFYQRLSSLWADLTFGEHPIVRIDDIAKKTTWHRFAEQTNQFWSVCYQAVVDLSRFGDCVFRIWFDESKGARIEVVSPQKWFPIIHPFTGETLAQVIAYEIESGGATYVRAEIHTPGNIENRIFVLKEGKLGDEQAPAELGLVADINTEVDHMLVFPVSKTTSSTDDLGQDDYRAIDSIIEGLEIRYTRIGRILDYHSEPDKGVPDTAFEMDDAGEFKFNHNKKVWPIIEGGALPQYITWAEGGIMSANFTHIDKLMERLYEVSETCKAAFDVQGVGQLSGTALRLLLSVPLKKAARIGSLLYPVIPRLVQAATELEVARNFPGAALIDDFTCTPQDGLPKDFTETCNNMVALKNSGLVSVERALHEIFGLDGAELDAEVEKIQQQTPATPALPKINPEQSAAKISADLAGYAR